MDNKKGRKSAKTVTKILDLMLKFSANSASSLFGYEPKAPEGLKKYKK